MIDKLQTWKMEGLSQQDLIDKINELVEEVNRLCKEPVPHYHSSMGCPNTDVDWNSYK